MFDTTGFFGNYGVGSGAPTGTRSFGYDARDRLTSSAIPNGSRTTSHTFGFDGNGKATSYNGASPPTPGCRATAVWGTGTENPI